MIRARLGHRKRGVSRAGADAVARPCCMTYYAAMMRKRLLGAGPSSGGREVAAVVVAGAVLTMLGALAWTQAAGAIYLETLLAGLATCF